MNRNFEAMETNNSVDVSLQGQKERENAHSMYFKAQVQQISEIMPVAVNLQKQITMTLQVLQYQSSRRLY
jgi:hypothetical protein